MLLNWLPWKKLGPCAGTTSLLGKPLLPCVTCTCYPTWHLCRLTHVPEALEAQGASLMVCGASGQHPVSWWLHLFTDSSACEGRHACECKVFHSTFLTVGFKSLQDCSLQIPTLCSHCSYHSIVDTCWGHQSITRGVGAGGVQGILPGFLWQVLAVTCTGRTRWAVAESIFSLISYEYL